MAFDDVRFPVDISYGSSGGPEFSTDVIVLDSGFERRNSNWSQARARYDAATGVQEQDDLADLIAFFRARGGRARGFRYRDWSDYTSAANGDGTPTPFDVVIGTGDGSQKAFQLVKRYPSGPVEHVREIRKPVAGTVQISRNGAPVLSGWTVDTSTGVLTFTTAPAAGSIIRAGFEFDVPCRFDTDRLSVRLDDYRQGSISVPIVEIRA